MILIITLKKQAIIKKTKYKSINQENSGYNFSDPLAFLVLQNILTTKSMIDEKEKKKRKKISVVGDDEN